ncbi:hypothetical protein UA08_05274 [Talaromyces atroroseus]|uniref:Uncharacterized protein n=1 Tax=Talaromyces atroroseus TaxID=1441469 RepID=A0A225AQZ5_TALAT|nr:hypothetical protein UA08_05274 [Talaromyces atroroseus]OKL59678.1 hypothetical protein UA08_05274 [Talaromyces atroroseus]
MAGTTIGRDEWSQSAAARSRSKASLASGLMPFWLKDMLLTLARKLDQDMPIMLKITYEYVRMPLLFLHPLILESHNLNPKHFPLIDDVEETLRVADRHVGFEVGLMDLVHSIGHGPQHQIFVEGQQNEWMPYPGGQIYFVAMSRVPGEDMGRIQDTLSPQQLKSIKSQLARILEAIADKNRVLRTADPGSLRSDKANDKL